MKQAIVAALAWPGRVLRVLRERRQLAMLDASMLKDIGISKAQLGTFLTLHGLLYGVSRFVNGMWADRANARYFMVAGLLLSVGANVFFGFSSAVLWFGVAWMINGWVQGMGFPPCCRLMTHWFRPGELATKMSIWCSPTCKCPK